MRHFRDEITNDCNYRFYSQPSEFDKNTELKKLKYCVGAALYMPATRNTVVLDIINNKFPSLTTIILDLEDALGNEQVEVGLEQIKNTLQCIKQAIEMKTIDLSDLPLIFIRPRNPVHLQEIVQYLADYQHLITGYAMPKFTPHNGEAFLSIVKEQNDLGYKLYAMPILETKELLYKEERNAALQCLLSLCVKYYKYILNIRIGTTDFCGILGIRRSITHSIYDVAVVRDCLMDIFNTFQRPENYFVISGSVWEYFSNDAYQNNLPLQGLCKEIELDRGNGLIGKTIIHPSQIKPVNLMYSVTHEEYLDAQSILNTNVDAIGVEKSIYGNKMNEMKPHTLWAERILIRAEIYGVLLPDTRYEHILMPQEV